MHPAGHERVNRNKHRVYARACKLYTHRLDRSRREHSRVAIKQYAVRRLLLIVLNEAKHACGPRHGA